MFDEWPFKSRSPDDMLEDIRQSTLGTLKLYIGSAPGVGKTYRMLQEAHDLKKEGIDVVIGLVETYGRRETEALIGDLEIIPLQTMDYKGRVFKELNVAAIIERRPQIVLIDELAHANVPGSTHPKRYMDVQEILAEGIHVISAVNIQHIESLHDIVQNITGVPVRERIPDHLLSDAKEVILIDVTPETLRKRLKDGKIYAPDKIERALQNFFTLNHLSALRELALREVADDVDEKAEKNGKPLAGPSEKILVCIQYDKNAEKLIRRGWRIANRLKTDLFILHVLNKKETALNDAERRRLRDWSDLSQQFGASFILEPMNNRKIAQVITDVALQRNITQIIMGQSARSRLEELTKGSIVNDIMRQATGIDIHIVSNR
ncbi:KdpD-like non-kinase potassium sensor [Camelliibacillus cellulosilyticus]|uniref:KdpD-like non-kinase potassium sensor n=1 Tax=Camelliibacillus cellulosilyticus TaxID=2174486 RepID=A0ABV9GPM8_9BACL